MTATHDGCRADKRKARDDAMSLSKGHPPAEEFAVVIAALLAGRIDGQQAVASCAAIHDRLATDTAAPEGHVCDTGHFDRTVCPEPCGRMHSFCATCGERQDPCDHEPSTRITPTPTGLPGYFVAGDAFGDPVVWKGQIGSGDPCPIPVAGIDGWRVRRDHPELWAAIVRVVGVGRG